MNRRQIALILILILELGYTSPGVRGRPSRRNTCPVPNGKGILPAAFEGYSGGSWSEFGTVSPLIAAYIKLLYRMYGIYCALFGLMGHSR